MQDDQAKFLFVGVMVVLALISRVDRDNSVKTAVQENIRDTSLTAAALPQLPYPKSLKPAIAQNFETLVSQTIPLIPYRKDWNLPEPQLPVKAAAAKDLDLESDFYRFNGGVRWPLASLTKLMTAVIALEEVGLEKVATVSQSAVESEGPAGDFGAGEQYSISDLLKAMLAVSSNDAAVAIAEFYGKENFVRQMQAKAAGLGMSETVFVDPTGLSFLNQGSISDLEKLISYIYKTRPEILEITRQEKAVIKEISKNLSKELANINNFAGRPEFLGGKTGFTDQAGGNLISIFNHGGHKILIIVLGTDDRFGQTEVLYNWIKQAYLFN
ncbi:MAG: D-alanyl-D-alanine carboxypeptidase [Candidatus Harrisonbacteria bacterium]|nr:D-alanyl-D-alanine carboxypeptidase [Candidatus Harrisonbacteria bacterium]